MKSTSLRTAEAQLRTMTAKADMPDPATPHEHAGHVHHGHDHHGHNHGHAHHNQDHAKSGAHGHETGLHPPGVNIEARLPFRAGLSLVRMSMGARLAIAAGAIVALWAIVLIAMM